MKTVEYRILFTMEDRDFEPDPIEDADDLRSGILDSMGFPLVFDEHPEYLVVEVISVQDV